MVEELPKEAIPLGKILHRLTTEELSEETKTALLQQFNEVISKSPEGKALTKGDVELLRTLFRKPYTAHHAVKDVWFELKSLIEQGSGHFSRDPERDRLREARTAIIRMTMNFAVTSLSALFATCYLRGATLEEIILPTLALGAAGGSISGFLHYHNRPYLGLARVPGTLLRKFLSHFESPKTYARILWTAQFLKYALVEIGFMFGMKAMQAAFDPRISMISSEGVNVPMLLSILEVALLGSFAQGQADIFLDQMRSRQIEAAHGDKKLIREINNRVDTLLFLVSAACVSVGAASVATEDFGGKWLARSVFLVTGFLLLKPNLLFKGYEKAKSLFRATFQGASEFHSPSSPNELREVLLSNEISDRGRAGPSLWSSAMDKVKSLCSGFIRRMGLASSR
mgnify:CR=1 FL=1